jgi:hypothetical protein
MQRLPDLLLSKSASDLFLACKSQFDGQGSVGNKPCDRLSERWYIAHRKKKSRPAIRNDIYDPSRRRPDDRYSGGLGLKNNCGQTFPVAWEDQHISSCVVRSSVRYSPRKNHMWMRLQIRSSVSGKRVAVLEASRHKQPEFWKSSNELRKGFNQLRNAFVTGQAANKEHDRGPQRDSQLVPQLRCTPHNLWCDRKMRSVHAIATARAENYHSLLAARRI